MYKLFLYYICLMDLLALRTLWLVNILQKEKYLLALKNKCSVVKFFFL